MNIYEQQAHNKRNTALILCSFVLMFLAVGIGFDYFIFGWRTPETQLQQVYDPSIDAYRFKTVSKAYFPFGTVIALVAGVIFAFYGFAGHTSANAETNTCIEGNGIYSCIVFKF